MFTDDTLKKKQLLDEQLMAAMKAMPAEAIPPPPPPATNLSGITLKPSYGPDDIKDLDFQDVGIPGNFPFTRGNYPFHYQVEPMLMNQGYGFATTEETRERREFLQSLGSRSQGGLVTAVMTLDLPTQRGLDPDHPAAKGKVGECGCSFSTIDDFAEYFDGLDITKLFTALLAIDNALPINALFAAYILDRRKENLADMWNLPCNLFHHQQFWDAAGYPPKTALKMSTELIKWHADNMPLACPGAFDGYNLGESGATPAMEVAFAMAHTIAAVEECQKVGLDPNDVVAKYLGHPHVSQNFFEEVAKLRATRRLWAKIFAQRFGVTNPDALRHKIIIAQTAGNELTAQEIYNNIIRVTVMTMAGMMADIEGMWVVSYDEAISIPTEEAVKVCVRTYQILQEETDLPHVTDPLGGSYYVEWLTNQMEQEILKIMDQMDQMGGYLKCWESGWIRGQVQEAAAKRFDKIQSGELVKVGVNKYRVEEANPEPNIYRRPIEIEEKAIERIKKYKANRDNEKVKAALENVKIAAIKVDKEWPSSGGVLMPALVEAARAGATAGEMSKVMQENLGYGYFSG
ncbi:MAG: methylmalonyl-CoA mutase family protein [Pseudomonadota bacterium]